MDIIIRDFHLAVEKQDSRQVSELLHKSCIDVDSLHNDQGVLHRSVQNKKNDITLLLLANGANPNIRTKQDHFTPLMFATAFANVDAIRLLLEYKADLEATDTGWRTAIHFASDLRCQSFLLLNGALPSHCDLLLYHPAVKERTKYMALRRKTIHNAIVTILPIPHVLKIILEFSTGDAPIARHHLPYFA